jgi:hypothetical protein
MLLFYGTDSSFIFNCVYICSLALFRGGCILSQGIFGSCGIRACCSLIAEVFILSNIMCVAAVL